MRSCITKHTSYCHVIDPGESENECTLIIITPKAQTTTRPVVQTTLVTEVEMSELELFETETEIVKMMRRK